VQTLPHESLSKAIKRRSILKHESLAIQLNLTLQQLPSQNEIHTENNSMNYESHGRILPFENCLLSLTRATPVKQSELKLMFQFMVIFQAISML
jgi:hypothetical protein